uniref:Cyclic nucleotide-binding domain-containing protein n=1 Tax=Timema monikensis TaxID=170555 RepID=A0A7R9E2Z2_9NEOP|nr:unnamed protein product [Timema monikensis]
MARSLHHSDSIASDGAGVVPCSIQDIDCPTFLRMDNASSDNCWKCPNLPAFSFFRYVFTIVSYLIGVFIFATIVGQVGNVITNRNANRLEFERLLDGAKTYMRHHKVPGGMKRRVLRWYDYSWSRGRIQGGGDINTALGLLPDKLKTELALHVNLSVLKKLTSPLDVWFSLQVTIFQECQPEFLHDLVLKMKAYIFTPGDLICRKGEVAREMFIIADGILEVMSETGRVLTTMKAGDFFGEIGILNLDGLNKGKVSDFCAGGRGSILGHGIYLSDFQTLPSPRIEPRPPAQKSDTLPLDHQVTTICCRRTADVRSVGYSELFSLSREDVLAAMKDYPEAQEILQSLGRKRLMEARNVNKPRSGSAPHSNKGGSTRDGAGLKYGSSADVDNKAGKRIVEKLRSDVKGIKNALRKSRRSVRMKEEALELQPLNPGSVETYRHDQPSCSYSSGKGMLRRMSRVRSDENGSQEDYHDEQSCEPIGAGLPLIQRLRILKEKTSREESVRPQVSPTSLPNTTILSPPKIRVNKPKEGEEEIQSKFQSQFQSLELEVRRRDEIISQLQQRIHELEQRGDSVDTVLASPLRHLPEELNELLPGEGISSRRHLIHRHSWEDHSEEESMEIMDLPRSISPQYVWSDNNSTMVNLGSDSSPDDELSDDETTDQVGEYEGVNNQDWEVQMLAKELERREDMSRLENEVQNLKQVVSSSDLNSLSSSELEILEKLLMSKDRKVRAASRALSLDSDEGWEEKPIHQKIHKSSVRSPPVSSLNRRLSRQHSYSGGGSIENLLQRTNILKNRLLSRGDASSMEVRESQLLNARSLEEQVDPLTGPGQSGPSSSSLSPTCFFPANLMRGLGHLVRHSSSPGQSQTASAESVPTISQSCRDLTPPDV